MKSNVLEGLEDHEYIPLLIKTNKDVGQEAELF